MTPTLGEIRIVGFAFAPVGWASCNGQLLSISENDALFTLLGTTYGGDGQQTFGVPDMRGRVVAGMGTGPGLSSYTQGQLLGTESVNLTQNQLPSHQHPVGALTLGVASGGTAQNSPANAYPGPSSAPLYAASPSGADKLAAAAVVGTATSAGNSQPHSNIQPILAMNYIIALEGIYPSRP